MCRIAEALNTPIPELNLTIVPRCRALGVQFQHRRPWKACGEDLIGAEIYKHFAREVLPIFLPIAFKSVVLQDSPIIFKDGCAFDLYKGKDEPEVPDSYRDITLAAESGKIIQATVRPARNDVVENYTENTQYGSGLNDGTTEMAHLYARACIDLARHRDLSLALIFIDVKTAFASMNRYRNLMLHINLDLLNWVLMR